MPDHIQPDDHVDVHVWTLDGRDIVYEVRRGKVPGSRVPTTGEIEHDKWVAAGHCPEICDRTGAWCGLAPHSGRVHWHIKMPMPYHHRSTWLDFQCRSQKNR